MFLQWYDGIYFYFDFEDTAIQRGFFRKLVEDGVDISIESNGVYYDWM